VEEKGNEEKKGRGREREGPPPLSQIPGSTPELKKHTHAPVKRIRPDAVTSFKT